LQKSKIHTLTFKMDLISSLKARVLVAFGSVSTGCVREGCIVPNHASYHLIAKIELFAKARILDTLPRLCRSFVTSHWFFPWIPVCLLN
jgi:hypothetical protein